MPIIEVDDGAVGVEGRGDDAQTADHALRTEAFAEPVDVPHAVQQRQNCRCWANRLGERRHRAVQVVGFATQQHEVDRVGQIFLHHSRRRGTVKVADGTANGQAVLRKLSRAARTNEKRHIAACLQQTSAEIAADCARSDNKNSHVTRFLSTKREAASRSQALPGAN